MQSAKILKTDKPNGPPFYIFTEGVNLRAARNLDFIDLNSIESNDIGAIFTTFGVNFLYYLNIIWDWIIFKNYQND